MKDKGKTEEALRRRTEELTALNAIAATVSSFLDLQEILDRALDKVLEVAGVEVGSMYLLDQQAEELVLATYRGVPREFADQVRTFKMGESLAGQAAQSGEPIVVDDLAGDPRVTTGLVSEEGIHSFAAIPMRSKEKLQGVMHIASHKYHPFSPEEVRLYTAIANQIGVAIENARLYQAERKRATQLAVVNQVARRAASILDLDQLLHEAVTAIQRSFNYHHVGLFLLDEIASEIKMEAIAGSFEDVAPPDHRLALGKGMVGWTAETGRSLLANDVSRESRYVLGILKEALTKAELCVPLKLAGKVIGVLDIQSSQLNAFDETDLMAVETLADQIAVAIENAQLYQETVRRLKETEALGTVTTSLTRSLDLDQVLQSIVDSAVRLIPASTNSVIHLVDKTAGKLMPRATSAPGVNIQEELGMSIGEGIAGFVVQEKRMINVPNVEEDSRFLATNTFSLKKSLLTAPLIVDEDCIGTLSLNSDQVGAFSADDEWLLTALAAQAAAAVKNARLFEQAQREIAERKRTEEEIRKRTTQLEALRQMGLELATQLDLDILLRSIVSRAVELAEGGSGGFYLYRPEQDALEWAVAIGPDLAAVGSVLRRGEGLSGKVWEMDKPLIVDDYWHWEGQAAIYKGYPWTAVVGVPVHWGEEFLGVLNVMADPPRTFSPSDVELLTLFATPAAIAIENARLYQAERAAREQLRDLAGYLQSVREEERTYIAREIHDEFSQALTALKMDLSWLTKQLPTDTPHLVKRASDMSDLIDATIQTVRRVATELRPGLLDDLGLAAAIEWQAQEFAERTGIDYELHLSDEGIVLDRDLATTVFRIFQESLTNVVRHAGATKVHVELEGGPDELVLVVRDDGKGIAESQASDPKSLGLIGMRERARSWGGDVTFQSVPGQGTTVTARIPQPQADFGERLD